MELKKGEFISFISDDYQDSREIGFEVTVRDGCLPSIKAISIKGEHRGHVTSHRFSSVVQFIRDQICQKIQLIDPKRETKHIVHLPILPIEPEQVKSCYLTSDRPFSTLSINTNKIELEESSKVKIEPKNLEPYENVVITDSQVPVQLWFRFQGQSTQVLSPGEYEVRHDINSPSEVSSRRFSVPDRSETNPNWIPDGRTPEDVARRFLTNSLIESMESRFTGLCHACFDYESNTYRLNSWIWQNGVVVSALLSEYQRTGDSSHLDRAVSIGERLLEHQSNDGGFVVRWDYPRENGLEKWRAPNDTAFISAYGFIPLYKTTRDERYLHAARKAGHWITENGLRSTGQLSAGYVTEWDFSWLYVDAGFTANLFNRLYQIDGDDMWKDVCSLYMDWYVSKFRRDNDLFLKEWRESGEHLTELFSRGQGWALDGLISSYHCTNSERFLQTAINLANTLLEYQTNDGAWYYLADDPATGKDNKGTPVIAYNLLRLSRFVEDSDKYISAAMKAIAWCEAAIERSQSHGYGGIKAWNEEGCIVGNRSTTTAFSYGNAFYLLGKARAEKSELAE